MKEGIVISEINETDVVINLGKRDGINKGDVFLLYNIGEELFDPETNENLGALEIVCGEGKVIHLQEKMATLQSNRYEVLSSKVVTTNENNGWSKVFGGTQKEERYDPIRTIISFENIEINKTHARFIS